MLKIRLLAGTAVLAVLAFLLPTATQASESSSILAKHFAYVGWSGAQPAFHTLVNAIKITNKNGRLRFAGQIRRLGLAYREDLRSVHTGQESSTGFTGNVAWKSDSNGFTTPILGNSARLSIDRDIIFEEAYSGLPASRRPSQKIAGVRYPVVRITPKFLPPFDLVFDPATGALIRATIAPDTRHTEVLQIDGYSDVLPGKRVISAFHVRGSNYRYVYSEFQPNAPLPVEQVEPPAQTATWDYANPKPFPIQLTQYRILVKATVDGVPGTFILDSGAAGIFFSRSFAAKAKLASIGHGEAVGVAGSSRIDLVKVQTLQIGGNTLSNVDASAVGEKGLGADGLIGFPLLADTITTVNFANQTMQIQDPSTVHTGKLSGIHAIVALNEGTPKVPMKIDGRIHVSGYLDTGDPYLVLIPKSLVFKGHLTMLVDNTLAGYFRSHVAVAGVDGRYQIGDCGRIDSIALGKIVYQDPKTCETTSFIGYHALVGLDFLRQFKRIIFDYPKSRMIFVPKV